MKFMHISDLHIGKRIHEFSMIEDQKYILNQISAIVKGQDIPVKREWLRSVLQTEKSQSIQVTMQKMLKIHPKSFQLQSLMKIPMTEI